MKKHCILLIISLCLLTSCAAIKQNRLSCPKFDTKRNKTHSLFAKNKRNLKTKKSKPVKRVSKTHFTKNNKDSIKPLDLLAIKSIKIKSGAIKPWSSLVVKRGQPKVNIDKIFSKNKKIFVPRSKTKSNVKNKSTKAKEEYKLEKSIVYNGFNAGLMLGMWLWFILSPAALPLFIMLPLSFLGLQIATKARSKFKKDYKLLGKTINGFYMAIFYITFQTALILLVLHFQALL